MNEEIQKQQCVYAVHVVDDKDDYIYIGSGNRHDRVGNKKAMGGNESKLHRGVHDNKQLQEAFDKAGKCFVEILEVCDTKEESRNLENDYIDHFKKIDGFIVCNKYPAHVEADYERKLNEEKVLEIRNLIAKGHRNKDLAKMYNVDPSTISRVKTGRRWGSV